MAPPPGGSWDLMFILPNLCLRSPSPFLTEWVCICSGSDGLLEGLADNPANTTGRRLLQKFTTTYGQHYMPSCLLTRAGAPRQIMRADTLRAFKNICCTTAVSHSLARTLTATGSTFLTGHGDHFLFGVDIPLADGAIGKVSSIVEGFSDEVDRFHGHPYPQIERPDFFDISVDTVLLRRLLRAWERHYLDGVNRRPLPQVFRSLEVAFQASLFPSVGLPGINDMGTRVGLWVSALEILFHPGRQGRRTRKVNELVVVTQLGRVRWDSPALDDRRFVIDMGKRLGVHRVNFVQAVYHQLYRSRNRFMHGERISQLTLKLRLSPRRLPLSALAPLLHNVALRAALARVPTEEDRIEDGLFGFSDIRDALIEARARKPGP